MAFVIPTTHRRTLLSGACVLLLAGCGGSGDAESRADSPSTQAATPVADSTAALPSFGAGTAPQGQAAPGTSAATPVPGAPAPQDRPLRDTTQLKQALEAPVTGPVNVQALQSYELNMDVVRRLVRVARNLAELQQRRPGLADSVRMQGFDPNAIFERINSIPEVREAITREGLNPRDYVMASAALMQSAMVRQMRAQGMQPQVQVNEKNVQFVDAHWEEIQQLTRSTLPQPRPQP